MEDTILPAAARSAPERAAVTPGQRLGSLIGGIFGLIYVEVNAGSLPAHWAVALRIAAGVVFAGLAALLALPAGPRPPADPRVRSGFGRGYWLVVAGEAAAIPAGAALISGPAGLQHAAVAWVSVVVGVHFVVLAAIWRLPLFRYLGVAMALCGIAGLSAAAAGASVAVTAGVGGVLPGALLLAAGSWGAAHARLASRAGAAADDVSDPGGQAVGGRHR